ncbi:hypothetical protein BHE74_00017839 [Ensete ventricosum]|nr:hypothetical protein GW17_00013904 [Ensete ventricosum]RWW74229.1 hypothetical protein BHE74_00017839 [Ensete ventricosum]
MVHTGLYRCTDTWYAGAYWRLDDEGKEREVEGAVDEPRRKEEGRRRKKRRKGATVVYLGSSDSKVAPSYALAKRQQQQWGNGDCCYTVARQTLDESTIWFLNSACLKTVEGRCAVGNYNR